MRLKGDPRQTPLQLEGQRVILRLVDRREDPDIAQVVRIPEHTEEIVCEHATPIDDRVDVHRPELVTSLDVCVIDGNAGVVRELLRVADVPLIREGIDEVAGDPLAPCAER